VVTGGSQWRSVVPEEARLWGDAGFRALVEASYDLWVVADDGLRVVWASARLPHVLGFDTTEAPGSPLLEFVHPDDVELATANLAAALAGEPPNDPTVVRARHRDGHWVWVEVVGGLVGDHPDLPGARFALSLRDVTHREEQQRRRDVERVRAEEDLRHSELRFRALLAHSSESVVIVGADGTIVHADPVRGLWGPRPDSQVLGTNGFSFVYRDDVDATREALGQVLTSPGAVRRTTFRTEDPDGRLRWVEATATNMLDVPEIGGIVVNFHDVTERIDAERAAEALLARLEHAATHDPLTGLPNRSLLLDRLDTALARATRSGAEVAVLFVDLDHFKVLNDGHGHSFGDRVLGVVAERLRAVMRPEDTVARFGGDEFVVVVEGIDGAEAALGLADRLAEALHEPLVEGGTELVVDASIGVTLRSAARDDATSPEVLLREADAAMYRAKESGRRAVAVYDEALRIRNVHRLDTEAGLRRALERDQLEVWLQPIVDLRTRRVDGVEALVRWRHPDRGVLGPAEFLPVAEEAGLLVGLGRRVLERTCELMTTWSPPPEELGGLQWRPEPSFAVNLSEQELADPRLVPELVACLSRSGADPGRLVLEITEGALMRDVHRSAATLRAVKELGVRVAVDDFGTGYSSLSYLRRFPVDVLKVDRSFVAGLGADEADEAVTAAVVRLAHTLGLDAVAEGVETAAQHHRLLVLGCDLAQGFGFAGPRPPEALTTTPVRVPV
jgi:diguanylate cyclase (GGDEF)-like protein/PAS domain S-box-containing protein